MPTHKKSSTNEQQLKGFSIDLADVKLSEEVRKLVRTIFPATKIKFIVEASKYDMGSIDSRIRMLDEETEESLNAITLAIRAELKTPKPYTKGFVICGASIHFHDQSQDPNEFAEETAINIISTKFTELTLAHDRHLKYTARTKHLLRGKRKKE